jgi:hypothetical protein
MEIEDINEFLGEETKKDKTKVEQEEVLIGDKSIVERINKKIITEDGRQLLM